MKYLFINILIMSLYVNFLHAKSISDTIYLPEVKLVESKIKTHLLGSYYNILNTNIIGNSNIGTFGDYLSSNSSFYIKQYGALATPTFRGTSSSHTLILWNGIPINSTANGIIDFSSISINKQDEIIIVHGGNSAVFGSGAIGGTIHINELTNNKIKENEILLTREVGSYGVKSSSIKLKHQKNNFSLNGSYLNLKDKNNFEYINTTQNGNPSQINDYGEKRNQESKMNASYKVNSKHKVSANYWHSNLEREVPQNMTTPISDAKQYDKNTRKLITTEHNLNNLKIRLKQAFLKEKFRYTEIIKNIDSKFKAESKISDIDIKFYSGKYLLNFGGNLNNYKILNNNYLGSILKEQQTAIFSSIQYKSKTLKINSVIRNEWKTNYHVPVLPSFAFELVLISNIKLRGKYNRNFRAPTFNDRFWVSSGSLGNINLKSEKGNNFELGVDYISKKFNFKITGYSLFVSNWILWQEQENGIWIPNNIKEVWSRGLEITSKFTYGYFNISSNYALTKSTSEIASNLLDQTVGKQLRYVPIHKGNILCFFIKDNYHFFINKSFTGEVITTYGTENNKTIDSFSLTDIGFKYLFKNMPLSSEIKIKNIENINYQTYQNYPSPGREFLITINYTIK